MGNAKLKAVGWLAILVATFVIVGCGQAQPDERLGSVELEEETGGTSGGPPPFSCTQFAGAPTIVNINAAADTQLEEALPTTNEGGLETCTMKGGSNKRHCLLQFDLTSIPRSTTVQGGCLTIFVADPSASDYPAAEMLRSWNEAEATWQRAKLAVPWQVPGAWGTSDSGATTVATLPKNQTNWVSIPITTSLVQSWVTSPASNYGILFGNNSSFDGASIGTKENAGGIAPRLSVWTRR